MLIAQLSDVHVRPRGRLYKDVVDSNRMLSDAIRHLHALDRRPDVVLLTGDIGDEGSVAEYEMASELLSELSLPLLLMPGNHDHRDRLRAAFPDHRYLPAKGPMHYSIDSWPVRIIALDSSRPGRHDGLIDADGLDWLRAALSARPDQPTIVALHHPPFVSGIGYLDAYRCFDDAGLASVIAGSPCIEAVVCGHVHRSMVRRWAGTVVMTCPSTTTEIALRLAQGAAPQSFLGPPACLLHRWDPAGGLVSHVSQIGAYPGPYPFF